MKVDDPFFYSQNLRELTISYLNVICIRLTSYQLFYGFLTNKIFLKDIFTWIPKFFFF